MLLQTLSPVVQWAVLCALSIVSNSKPERSHKGQETAHLLAKTRSVVFPMMVEKKVWFRKAYGVT